MKMSTSEMVSCGGAGRAALPSAVPSPVSCLASSGPNWASACCPSLGTNGSRLVTWENFALGRDTNAPVNAQIELRPTGDFVTRSNEVETVCLRVDPEDWDGDGWQNDDDPDPCNADEFGDEFCQELPEGDAACNYYWIEVCPRWNSWIVFDGDGPSDLDDSCFRVKAGETYRVSIDKDAMRTPFPILTRCLRMAFQAGPLAIILNTHVRLSAIIALDATHWAHGESCSLGTLREVMIFRFLSTGIKGPRMETKSNPNRS